MSEIRIGGWIRNPLDRRDRQYSMSPVPLSPRMDLSTRGYDFRPVFDQLDEGSCVWNAVTYIVLYLRAMEHKPFVMLSRQFGYNVTRMIAGLLESDAGCVIRDSLKVLFKYGICPEADFPYSKASISKIPPKLAFRDALDFQALEFMAVDNTNLNLLKNVIASGYPLVGGLMLYDDIFSIKTRTTGRIQIPDGGDPVGGHALCFMGYNDLLRIFFGPNSWGPEFGINGWFSVSYDYVTDPYLAGDFQCIKKVE